jgi:hypothetical protein
MALEKAKKVLVAQDIVLFCLVVVSFMMGLISTPAGLLILATWMVVFFLTILAMTAHISQGSDEWYHYGILFATGILIAMVIGMVLGFDVYGISLIVPFAVIGAWAVDWMFTDRSEEAIEKDLKELEKEID